MKRRMTVDIKQSGQPRPYADHRMVAIITFEYMLSEKIGWKPSDLVEDIVTPWIVAYLRLKEKPDWYDEKLTSMRRVDKGVWEVKTTQAFDDRGGQNVGLFNDNLPTIDHRLAAANRPYREQESRISKLPEQPPQELPLSQMLFYVTGTMFFVATTIISIVSAAIWMRSYMRMQEALPVIQDAVQQGMG